MRALGFQVAKKEVVALVDEVDVHRSGRVDFNDYMEISAYSCLLMGGFVFSTMTDVENTIVILFFDSAAEDLGA